MTTRIYLDTRNGKDEYPLKIALTIAGKTALFPLLVRVKADQWDKDKQIVKEHPNKKELNLFLSSKKNEVDRELLKLSELGMLKGKSVTEVKDMVLQALNPGEKRGDFIVRFERFMSLKSGQTRDSYEWTLKKLRDFDADLEKRSFEDISKDYLMDFLYKQEKLAKNSKSILMRNIKAVFNDAIDMNVTTAYPFRKFVIPSERKRKISLTLEQARTLAMMDCEKEHTEYRDMFMLMLYLRGVNTIDLLTALPTQIVNGRFEYRRSKVGTLFSVKIEPEAMDIINRYRGKKYLLSPLERYKNYRDYQAHLNNALKKIGCIRGKNRKIMVGGMFPKLSSNWARHTWGTIGLNIGISKEVVSMGMGHSFGAAVTDGYIDFDFGLVDAANRKIIDAVTK